MYIQYLHRDRIDDQQPGLGLKPHNVGELCKVHILVLLVTRPARHQGVWAVRTKKNYFVVHSTILYHTLCDCYSAYRRNEG